MFRLDGDFPSTQAYRSVLSAAGSWAMSGASRWLDAETPTTDVRVRSAAPARATIREVLGRCLPPCFPQLVRGLPVVEPPPDASTGGSAVGPDTRAAPGRMSAVRDGRSTHPPDGTPRIPDAMGRTPGRTPPRHGAARRGLAAGLGVVAPVPPPVS